MRWIKEMGGTGPGESSSARSFEGLARLGGSSLAGKDFVDSEPKRSLKTRKL